MSQPQNMGGLQEVHGKPDDDNAAFTGMKEREREQ